MIDDKPEKPAPKTAAERRAERLKAELRTNLARRKLQARARREGAEDDRPGDLISSDRSDKAIAATKQMTSPKFPPNRRS